MKYVLDSNIALKWCLVESDSPKAKNLRDEFQRAVHRLLAPNVFEIEIAHALTRAERQGKIAVGHAGILWTDIMSTPPHPALGAGLLTTAVNICTKAADRKISRFFEILPHDEQAKRLTKPPALH